MNNAIHTWALRLKGPVYVAMFKPLSIAIAVAMGVMFLGDTLHLGRYETTRVSIRYLHFLPPLIMRNKRSCTSADNQRSSYKGHFIYS